MKYMKRPQLAIFSAAGSLFLVVCFCFFAWDWRKKSIQKSKIISDISHLKNIYIGIEQYASEHGGYLPPSLFELGEETTHTFLARPSQPKRELLFSDYAEGKSDYVYVGGGLNIKGMVRGLVIDKKWRADNPEAHRTVIMHTKPGQTPWITFLFHDGSIMAIISNDSDVKNLNANQNWIYGMQDGELSKICTTPKTGCDEDGNDE